MENKNKKALFIYRISHPQGHKVDEFYVPVRRYNPITKTLEIVRNRVFPVSAGFISAFSQEDVRLLDSYVTSNFFIPGEGEGSKPVLEKLDTKAVVEKIQASSRDMAAAKVRAILKDNPGLQEEFLKMSRNTNISKKSKDFLKKTLK